MSIRDYNLFIFDWDGTLSTSTAIVRISNLLKGRYRHASMMKHREEYMRRAAKNIKITEERDRIFAFLYDIYSAMVMPKLKDGALDLLKALRKKGKKIAIFSDSESYRLMVEIRRLKVLEHVDFVLSASSIGYYKPDPTGIMLIADKYKMSKRRTVYVGDMPSDIMTAKFAGIPSCGLADGLAPYNMLKEAEPDHIFRNTQAMLKEISG